MGCRDKPDHGCMRRPPGEQTIGQESGSLKHRKLSFRLQGFVRAVVVANEKFGEMAISGAQDSCIKMWDMRAPHSSRCIATLTDHTAEVCFLSIVDDKLFSGSAGANAAF